VSGKNAIRQRGGGIKGAKSLEGGDEDDDDEYEAAVLYYFFVRALRSNAMHRTYQSVRHYTSRLCSRGDHC